MHAQRIAQHSQIVRHRQEVRVELGQLERVVGFRHDRAAALRARNVEIRHAAFDIDDLTTVIGVHDVVEMRLHVRCLDILARLDERHHLDTVTGDRPFASGVVLQQCQCCGVGFGLVQQRHRSRKTLLN